VIREQDADGECVDVHHYNADEDSFSKVQGFAKADFEHYELELCRRVHNTIDGNEEEREYFYPNRLHMTDVAKRISKQVKL
jgi:hypothetical protein